jgi:DNA-binding transcriptional regulator YdaS (Cro superfamily)
MRLRVAKALKITHGAVSQWKRVPAERVLTVEKVTGIPRHILRPDLYPDPMEAAE